MPTIGTARNISYQGIRWRRSKKYLNRNRKPLELLEPEFLPADGGLVHQPTLRLGENHDAMVEFGIGSSPGLDRNRRHLRGKFKFVLLELLHRTIALKKYHFTIRLAT